MGIVNPENKSERYYYDYHDIPITTLFSQVQCLGYYRRTLFILGSGLYQVFLDSLKLSSYR